MGDSVRTGLPQAGQRSRDGRFVGPGRRRTVCREEPGFSILSGGAGPGPDPIRRAYGGPGLPPEPTRFPVAGAAGRLWSIASGGHPLTGGGTGARHRTLADYAVGSILTGAQQAENPSQSRFWDAPAGPSLALFPGASCQPSSSAHRRGREDGGPLFGAGVGGRTKRYRRNQQACASDIGSGRCQRTGAGSGSSGYWTGPRPGG